MTNRTSLLLVLLPALAASCFQGTPPAASATEPNSRAHSQPPAAASPVTGPSGAAAPLRNNVSEAKNIPLSWKVGQRDPPTGRWSLADAANVKWMADVDTSTWAPGFASGPAVAGGKVFIGSNNRLDRVERIRSVAPVDTNPQPGDLATPDLPQRAKRGIFMAVFQPPGFVTRGPTGKGNAMAGTPYVEGERLWLVTNRQEVVCLDTEGFHDQENDGPYRKEPAAGPEEADVIWVRHDEGLCKFRRTTCAVARSRQWATSYSSARPTGSTDAFARAGAQAPASWRWTRTTARCSGPTTRRAKHSPRAVVVAGVGRARRRAASPLWRRRRLAVQLPRRKARTASRIALEVRHQPQGSQV